MSDEEKDGDQKIPLPRSSSSLSKRENRQLHDDEQREENKIVEEKLTGDNLLDGGRGRFGR